MNALPTSGVRQSCGRMPVESRCVIKDDGYCLQDVNQIEREIRSNGAFRSNRQFRSKQTSLHSADMTYISLCYDFRAIHISIGLI